MDKIVAIIGIGYVGLQNALAIAKLGLKVIAFDTNHERISELKNGFDKNHEALTFTAENLHFTDDAHELENANYYLISVPTPVNTHFVPDIFPLKSAARQVGETLKKEDVVVLESTVFPGATRELLIPILEELSGLKSGTDFFVGYSSERIVPGDNTHNLSNMYKVISGQNPEALKRIKDLYEQIVPLRLHCAPSLEVAESSKLLENIQRDVNIALMNEYAQVMEKIGVSLHDVLEASGTKWNFLPFKPGLVGGHCIPEDPYYLIYQASKVGALTNLISCARQTNEQFVRCIADTVIKLLMKQKIGLNNSKIVLLGASFKPNVSDMRHSLSIVLYKYLKNLGFDMLICDPIAHQTGFNLNWIDLNDIKECSAVILTQAHDAFITISPDVLSTTLIEHGVFIDIPCAFTKKAHFRPDIYYWSL
jgi:UDP-N-acetyl-D-galactosamine dehydrogenase